MTSRMREPVGENRGMTMPTGGWTTWLSVVTTQKHILKKPVFGALNVEHAPPNLSKPPMPPFSFLRNSTIHWLKSCRERKIKGGFYYITIWFLWDCVHLGRIAGVVRDSNLRSRATGLRTPRTHLFGPLQSFNRVGMQYFYPS